MDRLQERPKKRIGRPPLPDEELVAEIEAVIAELPTYGYRRVHAILKRRSLATGRKPPNHKRIYRVMKARGLLLDRHAGGAERRHDGRIAVDERNRRWCSDGFEIGCDNGEKVRIAFAPKLSTESLREAAPPVVNLTKNACVRVQLASCGPCTCPSVRESSPASARQAQRSSGLRAAPGHLFSFGRLPKAVYSCSGSSVTVGAETIMLAFCTSPSEIALVLKQSDANWLSEEMSFLSELYRSRAGPLLRSIQRTTWWEAS